MDLLQLPKKRPEYRQNRDHNSFLTKLNYHCDDVLKFETHVLDQLSNQYQLVREGEYDETARFSSESRLLGGSSRQSVVRTKVEDVKMIIKDSNDAIKNSLLHRGSSCLN